MINQRFSLDRTLSSEDIQKAELELRETPNNVEEGIRELLKLLRDDASISYQEDEEFLISYLRPCKFYPESAFGLMKRIIKFKRHYTLLDLSVENDIKPYIELDCIKVMNVLVDRDQHGRRILIITVGGIWDPRIISAEKLFRILYVCYTLSSLEPKTQINGVVIILDLHNLTMRQVAQITPAFSRKLLTLLQDASALRVKEVHIVNQSSIFKIIWNVLKSLLREKIKNRLYIHGNNLKSLHDSIKPEYLPSNYGGYLGKIDYSLKDWYSEIEKYKHYLQLSNEFDYVHKM